MKNVKLAIEQKKALDLMHSGKNVFLTGKAGTGKSTAFEVFVETSKRECVLLAPTGIAAINIKGQTIHSFFLLKPGLLTPESIEPIGNRKRIELIRSVETIVIDEISMVRSDLFVAIDMRLKEVTGCHKPFAGKQIILVGDFLQLPPVVKEKTEAEYLDRELGGYYAFQTNLWKRAKFQCVCLQTNHRQGNDARFMAILNHVRYGELDTRDLLLDGQDEPVNVSEALTRLCVEAPPLEQPPIYLCTTNRESESINQFHQNALKGEVHVFRAMVDGKFPKSDFPTSELLSLKIGARVMTLANKYISDGVVEYVNGETGIIEDIEDGENAVVRVRLDRGSTVSIQGTKWTKPEYVQEFDANSVRSVIRQREVGSFVQIPLKPAYAFTIHKAQGLTMDCVEIKLGNGCFTHGQLYTGLSRCRSIKNLRIDRPIHPADVIIDHAVIDFYRDIEAGQQPKRKHRAVTLNIPAEDEEAVKAFLAQLHGEKIAAIPRVKDADAALPESDADIVLPEPKAEEEPDGHEQRITASPDIEHLLIVYHNQTVDEKNERQTKRVNNIGFNKFDAPILTELAEEYLDQGYLTESDLATVKRLIPKYRRQWS